MLSVVIVAYAVWLVANIYWPFGQVRAHRVTPILLTTRFTGAKLTNPNIGSSGSKNEITMARRRLKLCNRCP